MKLTTKGRYGLRAIINLAVAKADEPVSIKTIAEKENISPEFLEQIFYQLKKEGIIASLRGPGGGFVLNRAANEISIRDILRAVGESIAPAPCTDENKGCERLKDCLMAQTWRNFYSLMDEFLSGITIKDILKNKPK